MVAIFFDGEITHYGGNDVITKRDSLNYLI